MAAVEVGDDEVIDAVYNVGNAPASGGGARGDPSTGVGGACVGAVIGHGGGRC